MKWYQRPTPARARPARHGRHGRLGRSDVLKPPLPALDSRIGQFESIVAVAAEYLQATWPELRTVSFEVGGLPPLSNEGGIPRWSVHRDQGRIVIYRVAIERLDQPHRIDDIHGRMIVEGTVFRAAAEYLEKDPWDLGLDRFRPE